MSVGQLDGAQAEDVELVPELLRPPVDELGAELDGAVGPALRPGPPARAVARLQHRDAAAGLRQPDRGREPGGAGAEHDDV